MLTIYITKSEMKKAFFGKTVDFSKEHTASSEPTESLDIVLLKIMLENYKPKEVA
ncbi:MAG: hypothetical protein FWE19_05950 [Oscillospiraceae bacterium]|nr:hypothetical protein [Oscillospiraceae bacterium]